jgi:hypothetical protein
MNKRTGLSALICLNVVLATAIAVIAWPAPVSAHAQAAGLAGNYLAVTGEIQDQFDALYVLDVRARTIHAFTYDRGNKQLSYIAWRDLERDFRNNRE